MIPDGVTPPHCDQSVLHAPGECRYCDAHPDWQAYRQMVGIAFTGHTPTPWYDGGPMLLPCPSDARRGTGEAHVWGGNRPTDADVPQVETYASRVMYQAVPVRERRISNGECANPEFHGNPFRYCACGWTEGDTV